MKNEEEKKGDAEEVNSPDQLNPDQINIEMNSASPGQEDRLLNREEQHTVQRR